MLDEKRTFRLIVSAFQIDVTCDQVLTVFVLIVAVFAVVELLHMSDDAHEAHLLLFDSLRDQVELVKVGMHRVRANVVLLLLSLFKSHLRLASLS